MIQLLRWDPNHRCKNLEKLVGCQKLLDRLIQNSLVPAAPAALVVVAAPVVVAVAARRWLLILQTIQMGAEIAVSFLPLNTFRWQ